MGTRKDDDLLSCLFEVRLTHHGLEREVSKGLHAGGSCIRITERLVEVRVIALLVFLLSKEATTQQPVHNNVRGFDMIH